MFEHSVVTSIPLNVVNDVYFNRAEWSYGAEELNERFRLGERFDLSRMDFSQITSTHQPVEPVFSGEDASATEIFTAWRRERDAWIRRVRELTGRLDDLEAAKLWLEDQCATWEDTNRRASRAFENLQAELDVVQERAALARREGDAVVARLDQLLRSPIVRITAQVVDAWNRGARRAALLWRLIPSFSLRRLVTFARLVSRGDFASIRERARVLAIPNLDGDAAESIPRTPVVLRNDPWPAGLPLVSVVVVCFNYGRYVEEAISSVLAQTAAEHCELIVVDGGSDDPETVATMTRLAANPPPRTTVLLRTDERHLVGDNRNYGIERARGRYVACLDADDLLDPRYLEVALYLLERRAYDVVSTTTTCFGLTNEFVDLKLAPDLGDMLRANHLTTVAVFRRELWERAGGFHDVGLGQSYVFEDWKLWLRFAALGARMTNIRAPLFRYRVHSTESLSRQGGIREMAAHRAAVKAFNEDVISAEALAESKRKRDLEITVEGAFRNLQTAETIHRPTVLLALPFTLIGGAERMLSAVAKHLADAGFGSSS